MRYGTILNVIQNLMTEKLVEAVLKSVLDFLRLHPTVGYTESQLEHNTRERIVSRAQVIERLRSNPRISYDSQSRRYTFKPKFALSGIDDLKLLLKSRRHVVIDSDLLECYVGAESDIWKLLKDRYVLGVRSSESLRNLKCTGGYHKSELGSLESSGILDASYCPLDGASRCLECSSNKGISLCYVEKGAHAEDTSSSTRVAEDLRTAYHNIPPMDIGEIRKMMPKQDRSQPQAVRATSSNPAEGSRFEYFKNRVANTHVLEEIYGSKR